METINWRQSALIQLAAKSLLRKGWQSQPRAAAQTFLSIAGRSFWPVTAMIVCGFGLRLIGLGSIGFAEDEINKIEAVPAYDRGDFTANAEHPMLMKVLMDLSMRAARAWNSISGSRIAEEAALRLPNVLFGALTAVPLSRGAAIVSETPGVVRYYSEKVGRTDLRSQVSLILNSRSTITSLLTIFSNGAVLILEIRTR